MLLCFFFNDTATTEIYTLSLHDALPIYLPAVDAAVVGGGHGIVSRAAGRRGHLRRGRADQGEPLTPSGRDRKGTPPDSSHQLISYAVFSLEKKNNSVAYSHDAPPGR